MLLTSSGRSAVKCKSEGSRERDDECVYVLVRDVNFICVDICQYCVNVYRYRVEACRFVSLCAGKMC